MKIFKDLFNKTFTLDAIAVDKAEIKRALNVHSKWLCKKEGLPTVLCKDKTYSTFKILSPLAKSHLVLLNEPSEDTTWVKIQTSFGFYNAHELISTFLESPPTSFETVGDVVHVNLKEEFLPYKYLIGKILHDKTGAVVINKLNNINNTFRYFDFEVIGVEWLDFDMFEDLNANKPSIYTHKGVKYHLLYGNTVSVASSIERGHYTQSTLFERDTLERINRCVNNFVSNCFLTTISVDKLTTIHFENGFKYFIDIKNCYWCSKLQSERAKLLQELKADETFCDVFCGVGPMILPALGKGCGVLCNDLNPYAIECLKKSITLNKLSPSNAKICNLDAADFLHSIKSEKVDHFFLNLPEHSLEYLKCLKGFKGPYKVHCYFFCKDREDLFDYVREITESCFTLDQFRFIRKVSPSKSMYKLSYTVGE